MTLLSGKTMRTTTFAPFAFLLLLRRVDTSDFPQSQSAKLQQRLSTEEAAASFCLSLSEETIPF